MRKPSRGLRHEKSAAVAVVFATSLVPISMLAGLVFDFGFVLQAKTKLDLAADAAALAALRTAAAGYAAGQTSATYMSNAQTAASQWWAAQVGTIPSIVASTVTPNITQSGPTFTANISYTATVYEVMPLIFKWHNAQTGDGNATIANTSVANIMINQYGTIDFVLDNTSSMLLPATDGDLAKLQTGLYYALQNTALQNSAISGANKIVGWTTSDGAPVPILLYKNKVVNGYVNPGANPNNVGSYCAFACHWSTTGQDYYAVARSSQVNETLRFDVVQDATKTAIQQMETEEAALGQLAVGIFDFGGTTMNTSSYVQTVFAETPLDTKVNGVVTKNAGGTAAINALSSIAPPLSGDLPNTNIGEALSEVQAITGASGTGATAASPVKAVILITDGVEDDTHPEVFGTTEGPINPSVCNNLKTAGYTIYVLYTPYASAPEYLVDNMPLQPYITGATTPSILSALQSCSSGPGDLIVASSPTDIQNGMQTLVERAVGHTTQLTN